MWRMSFKGCGNQKSPSKPWGGGNKAVREKSFSYHPAIEVYEQLSEIQLHKFSLEVLSLTSFLAPLGRNPVVYPEGISSVTQS